MIFWAKSFTNGFFLCIILLMRLILASKSPRRKEILTDLKVDFDIIPAVKDEVVDYSLSKKQIVQNIALCKAKEVFEQYPDCAVIGADTIVVLNDEILQKPKDKQDATQMLKKLSGKTHSVLTGYALLTKDKSVSGVEESFVQFNKLSDQTIENYVNSGLCMDKAGAYGVQDGFGLVNKVEGSYYNVVGFPYERFQKILCEFGFIKGEN